LLDRIFAWSESDVSLSSFSIVSGLPGSSGIDSGGNISLVSRLGTASHSYEIIVEATEKTIDRGAFIFGNKIIMAYELQALKR
jgi:hypothetical protein